MSVTFAIGHLRDWTPLIAIGVLREAPHAIQLRIRDDSANLSHKTPTLHRIIAERVRILTHHLLYQQLEHVLMYLNFKYRILNHDLLIKIIVVVDHFQ